VGSSTKPAASSTQRARTRHAASSESEPPLPTAAKKAASLSLCIALLALAPSAAADCPLGASFFAEVSPSSNTVTILVSPRGCSPGAPALLRQDSVTGALVQLGTFCDASGRYLDECVPAGSYRYGYAVPFTCADKDGCGGDKVPYFTLATVTALGSCTRSASDPAPTAWAGPAPWGDGATQYLSCGSGFGCAAAGGGLATNVAALDLGAVALALVWLRLRKRRRA